MTDEKRKPWTREGWAVCHPEASWGAIIKLKRKIAAEWLMRDWGLLLSSAEVGDGRDTEK